MPFTRNDFTLFWTLPPDDQDWTNLRLSKVKRMQLVLAFTNDHVLRRLRDEGVRRVTVRLDEPDYASEGSRQAARDKLAPLISLGVDTVQIGVEPENGYDLRYGSPSWGQPTAFLHARWTTAMIGLLQPLGVRIVSAGWTCRAKDMNWREGLFPGEQTWLEITREAYNACDLNGFHWYSYDGSYYDVRERMRRTLWLEQNRRHKPLYIDEVGVDRGTELERMRTYLNIATLLLDRQSNEPFALSGERVAALCPFTSNGNGVGWDSGFLIRDPAAYRLVGQFMDGVSF